MKLHKAITAVAAGVAFTALGVIAPASADPRGAELDIPGAEITQIVGDITITGSGTSSEGAWVSYTGTGSVSVSLETETPSDGNGVGPQTTIWIDGGTWDFGGSYNSIGQKSCRSYYHHPTKYHSSTVTMSDLYDKQYAYGGNWSYAYVQKWTTAECFAYYNV